MKKIGVKKCLLYISLVPYVFVLLMSIYHAIFGFDYNIQGYEPLYGIRGATSFIDSFWEYNFGINLIVLLLCVSYQAYYLITSKKSEQKLDNENTDKVKNKINIKKILFVISILCWVAYLMTGVYGYFNGISDGLFSNTEIYGIEAMLSTLFWVGIIFCYIPVLPITLIYIVIYIVLKIKEKRKSKLDVNKEV